MVRQKLCPGWNLGPGSGMVPSCRVHTTLVMLFVLIKVKNSLKIMYLYYLKNKTKPNPRQLQIKVGPLCPHPPISGLFPTVTLLSGWCLFSEHSVQAATYLRGCSIVWFACVCVLFDILNLILYLAFFTQLMLLKSLNIYSSVHSLKLLYSTLP